MGRLASFSSRHHNAFAGHALPGPLPSRADRRIRRQEDLFGDDRLASNALVVGVEVDDLFKGYSVEALTEVGGVVNDTLASQPIVVLYDDVARTGLAFSRAVDGQLLEFYNAASQGFELRDRQTQSLWDREGRSISGPLVGTTLEFVPSFISEWYGWSAYHPESELFQG